MVEKRTCYLNIQHMCEIAGVSRSGYYSWIQREQYRIDKESHDRQDFELILKAFKYKNRYKGAKSIKTDTIHLLTNNKAYIISKDAYLHSDQGVHYTSSKFQKLIQSKGFIQSMSRKGNCWDNAPQESFFGHMKDELNLNQCETFERLKYEINEYMNYYNNERYQWELMKMTPNEYYKYLTTGIMPY